MIPKEQREEWRKLAVETTNVSALGEYTPEEFITLLDAVDELEEKWFILRNSVQSALDRFVNDFTEEARMHGEVRGSIAAYMTSLEMIDMLQPKESAEQQDQADFAEDAA